MAKKSTTKREWYDIIAPKSFENKKIGDTLASSPEKLVGRVIRVGLSELMPQTKKYYLTAFFRIKEVEGNVARTELIGHTCTREYLLRLVRRRSTRIDCVKTLKTKDGVRLKVKLFGITLKRVNTSLKHDLILKLEEMLEKKVKDSDFELFMMGIFTNDVQREIVNRIKKTYPFRALDFRMTAVESG